MKRVEAGASPVKGWPIRHTWKGETVVFLFQVWKPNADILDRFYELGWSWAGPINRDLENTVIVATCDPAVASTIEVDWMNASTHELEPTEEVEYEE